MSTIKKEAYLNVKGYRYKLDSVDKNYKARKQAKLRKWLKQFKHLGIIIAIVLGIYAVRSLILNDDVISQTHSYELTEEQIIEQHSRFINIFPLEKTIIGCYNDRTKTTRQAMRCTKGGDHNIKLPPRHQIVIWLKYYTEHQILNRLALVNFESDFNIHAINNTARGYVQTKIVYNIPIDIDSQLQWLKNTQSQHSKDYIWVDWNNKIPTCKKYWDSYNLKDGVEQGEYGVLSCLYRRHYHRELGTWYANRGIKATKFYKEYLFGITD